MLVRNEDTRSQDYDEMRSKYRPSHADFAYDEKFGSVPGKAVGGRPHERRSAGSPLEPLPSKSWPLSG